MDDTAKYLIHADITANGVVERNDVVGAIFGQTEGLLGEDLDLRELQDHSKVGRIDVTVDSEAGQSFGEITIASGLDRVETALLAASLETIERVGPCRATIEVSDLEDVRSAKRRAVVDRATDLLAELEDESVTSVDIVEEVRQRVRVEDVTEYEGYPAGPRVADSDAIIVVEGRADVLQLLQYGVKNAVAVEGTDVPDAIADLTRHRTVTAFVDGDRGGELVCRELAQVGDVDYVAFAPPGTAVEDLSRGQIMAALREKVPYETLADVNDGGSFATDEAADGGTSSSSPDPDVGGASVSGGVTATLESAPPGTSGEPGSASTDRSSPAESSPETGQSSSDGSQSSSDTAQAEASVAGVDGDTGTDPPRDGAESESTDSPETIAGHAHEIIGDGTGRVRLLDADASPITDGRAEDAFELVEGAESVPATVVLDGPVTQRLLDVAAQRGVDQVVAASEGEFVKRPTSVRVRTIDEF